MRSNYEKWLISKSKSDEESYWTISLNCCKLVHTKKIVLDHKCFCHIDVCRKKTLKLRYIKMETPCQQSML